MADFIYSFGGLEEGHDLPEQLVLPTLKWLPAIPAARQAVDNAAVRRQGVLLLGPRGAGKSAGLRVAAGWYTTVQRARAQADSNYRQQHVVQVFGDRDATYWDTAVNLVKKLNPRYSEKVRGRKKDQNEIRTDLIEIALTTERTVFIVDECEKCSEDALLFFRDLLAQAEEIDLARRGCGEDQLAAGIGVVLAGTPDLRGRPAIRPELMHRWSQQIEVPQIRSRDCAAIYRAWLPGFVEYIDALGEDGWANQVTSVVAPLRNDISIRFVNHHVRLYVLLYARSHRDVRSIADVAFNEALFVKAFNQARGGDE